LEGKIRVGVMLDSFAISAWARRMLAEVAAMPEVEVALVVMNTPAPASRPASRPGGLLGNLAIRAYNVLDRRLNRRLMGMFTPTDCRDILSHVPVMKVGVVRKGYNDYGSSGLSVLDVEMKR
jgi:hypothetical protein